MTPSITVALILFAVGLTGLLAYRAFDASRGQQQVVERTLRDYAGFAAFQIKNATFSRIAVQHRPAFDLLLRLMNTRNPPARFEGKDSVELVEEGGRMCQCLEGISFYYQVTFADSGIKATSSQLATPENLRRIRDTIIAYAVPPARTPPPGARPTPLGVPITSQYFVIILSKLGGQSFVLMYMLNVDPRNAPLAAYGFVVPAEQVVGSALKNVLRSQPVLPRTLTRDLSVDSILSIKVRDASRGLIYQTDSTVSMQFGATDSLDTRLGGLHFEVAIHPAAASRLIIGGMPRSRLPEVLATAFIAMGLLGLLLYQFRRQEELGRLRDDFVSGVSHELRTPLAQIRLLAELLRMGKVPAEGKERSLGIIDKEARRLSFLVESILSFTRSQPKALAPVSTEVADEIEEIVTGFAPLAQARNVTLTPQLERGIVADVDRGALRQVLLNLLDNAVRYGPPRQSVTITTTRAGDSWTLAVADEGPGVPAEEADRIFSPYYRMKRDAGGAVGGTGIGLAVVRRIVKEHGGRVHVAPARRDGVGARFVVTLPMQQKPGATSP